MESLRRIVLYFLALFLLIGLVFVGGNRPVSSSTPSNNPSPANKFTRWERWSDTHISSTFDLTRCGHPTGSLNERIVTADLNGDGRDDLFCMYEDADGNLTEAVQLSQGDHYVEWELWSNHAQFPEGNCQFAPPADVNGDGMDDGLCLYVDPNNNNSTLYTRLSTGTKLQDFGVSMANGASPTFLFERCQFFQTSDVNGDGNIDIICHYLNNDNSSVTLVGYYPTNNDPRIWHELSPVAASHSFRVDYCVVMEKGDVDGDGTDDLICTYSYSNGDSATFVQLVADGAASGWTRWSDTETLSAFDYTKCHYLQTGDIDGDGLIDRICAVAVSLGGTDIYVQTDTNETPGFQFDIWTEWDETNELFNLSRCYQYSATIPTIVDVNGDGLSDLICVYLEHDGAATTYVQLSTGTSFSGWETWSAAQPANIFQAPSCHNILLGDANGDNHTDILCPYRYPDNSHATFVQWVELYRQFLPIAFQ